MRSMISQHAASDPLWRHVGFILAQYDGLVAGYKHHAPPDQVSTCIGYSQVNENHTPPEQVSIGKRQDNEHL